MQIVTNEEYERICAAIRIAGGRPLLVGGTVRDAILGIPPQDFDSEVYGLDATALLDVLRGFGSVKGTGVRFGVLKLATGSGQDYDFSLPRRENKAGRGHKGFQATLDPSMTIREAAARRDYTFGALAYDPASGELFDFFGGVVDLQNRRLRATTEHYVEDAPRVLRGMQFAGRFDLTCEDPATIAMAQTMQAEYADAQPSLPDGPVWQEWKKWAQRSVRPAAGLRFLAQAGWLQEFYPAFADLMDVSQDQAWHPEGGALEHTFLTVDAAATIAARDGVTGMDRLALLFAAGLHDAGKATTTSVDAAGRIVSPGHCEAGVAPAEQFLRSIGAPAELIRRVAVLVAEHMAHLNEQTPRTVRRLAARLAAGGETVQNLARVIEADHSARPPLPAGLPAAAAQMLDLAAAQAIQDSAPRKLLTGAALLNAGWGLRPGPAIGRFLAAGYEAQLDGAFSDAQGALDWAHDHREQLWQLGPA